MSSPADRVPRTPEILPDRRLRFGRLLRAWYRRSARDLPWRRTRDPYHILVSELMLQQTQVSRVLEKYGAFLHAFPTLETIAAARPRQIREAWSGLGYYARAANLHRLARTVVRDSGGAATLPARATELRALPGIGRYTAGAVASFAFEERSPLVDTNVARVLRRAFAPALARRGGANERVLWQIAEAILPRTRRATYVHNQALMELGALICTARVAHCTRCPVRSVCATARTGWREQRGRIS
jgi:A/G-specific adenine glycosylase